MSLVIHSEDIVLKELTKLAETTGTHVGLLIGQVTSQRSYVIHAVPTPEQSKDAFLSSLKDVDEVRMGEHARYVTRMLPGGLYVLGAFVVSSDDVFSSSLSGNVKKIISSISKAISEGFTLHGLNPLSSLFALQFNGTSKTYQAKTFDKSGAVKNVDWKFQNSVSNWLRIETEYTISQKVLETSAAVTFHEQIKNLHDVVLKDVSGLEVSLNCKYSNPATYLDEVKRVFPDKPIKANLLRRSKKESSSEVKISDCVVQILLLGTLPSRVFLHPRTTFDEASAAVREDIVRSLSARLEMHLDSLVDETEDSPEEERVHVPPRRVLVRPNGWNIQLSDFLFPGENSEQTIRTYKELLDIDVGMEDIECEFEQFPDGIGLLSSSQEEIQLLEKPAGGMNMPAILIVIAVLIILAAIFAQYFAA